MMSSTTGTGAVGGAGVPTGADAEGKPAPAAADPALARQFERSLRERAARPRPPGRTQDSGQDGSQEPAAPPWLAGPLPLPLQQQLPAGAAALRSDAATASTTAATAPRDGGQEAALSRHSGAQPALDSRLAGGPGRWQLEINPQTLQAGLLLNAERHASAPAGASWSLQLAAGQAAWVAGSQQALAARLRRSGLQVHELQLSASGRVIDTEREFDSEPGDD